MDFMAGEGRDIQKGSLQVDRHSADRLRNVGVDEDILPCPPGFSSHRVDGLDHASLAVCPLNAKDDRAGGGPDRITNRTQVNQTIR
jgi:hypothetical protein